MATAFYLEGNYLFCLLKDHPFHYSSFGPSYKSLQDYIGDKNIVHVKKVTKKKKKKKKKNTRRMSGSEEREGKSEAISNLKFRQKTNKIEILGLVNSK